MSSKPARGDRGLSLGMVDTINFVPVGGQRVVVEAQDRAMSLTPLPGLSERTRVGIPPSPLRVHFLGWRDGSVVKSIDCSLEGPEFKSQQPHGGSQPSIMKSDTHFWSV